MSSTAADRTMNSSATTESLQLTVVIPTFNEKDNVSELVRRLDACLDGIAWEAVFVDDDSYDGTADVVRSIARKDRRIRCVQRIGRRGLSSACIEGMMASAAPFVAVMDADLQHDETLLSQMFETLQRSDFEIVIGSRYVEGGGIGAWNNTRASISRIATTLGRSVLRVELADPMSGFFMIRSDVFRSLVHKLSARGFKILADIMASAPRPLRHCELPFHFRERIAGESKLDSKVALDYVMLLLDKSIGKYIPVRFISFAAVGAVGVAVHFAILAFLFKSVGIAFAWAQTYATMAAMTFNFIINNIVTYRDQRLHGLGLILGWFTFVLACSVGGAANVGVSAYLFSHDTSWALSALSGVLIGAVWNYAVTSVYTWRAN